MDLRDIFLLASAFCAAGCIAVSVWFDTRYHTELNTGMAISLLSVIFFSILPRNKKEAVPYVPELSNMERVSQLLIVKILKCENNEKLEECKDEVAWFQKTFAYTANVDEEIKSLADALLNKEIDFIINGVIQ